MLDCTSIEEMCAADADAGSHFVSLPSLLYLAYGKQNMSFEEGKEFVKRKLERSFQKLSHQSKDFYLNKYRQVVNLLT